MSIFSNGSTLLSALTAGASALAALSFQGRKVLPSLMIRISKSLIKAADISFNVPEFTAPVAGSVQEMEADNGSVPFATTL